jgi:hypothetical protein
MGLGEVATRDWIRSELQDLLKELEERQGDGDRQHQERRQGVFPAIPAEHPGGRDMDDR